jgi:predicted site-specific integrase-resolvase
MRNLRDLVTIRQAADMIGVSHATLRDCDRTGKLRAVRNPANRYRLCRVEDVRAFLEKLRSNDGTELRRREG